VSALDLARRSFTLGNTGIIDVIDAQRQFAQAELGLSRARAQRLMDTAQLYLALGGTPLAGAAPQRVSMDGEARRKDSKRSSLDDMLR
jgi:outer membrane protein TolC